MTVSGGVATKADRLPPVPALTVKSALAIALSLNPVRKAMALTVMLSSNSKGASYRYEFTFGSVLSRVYRIVAPYVAVSSTTVTESVYVPPGGLMVGVATLASARVRVAAARLMWPPTSTPVSSDRVYSMVKVSPSAAAPKVNVTTQISC